MRKKNPRIAVLLAALPPILGIYGLGYIYVGKVGTGIAWLVGVLVLAFATFILKIPILSPLGLMIAVPMVIAWVRLSLEAYHAAEEYNEAVLRTGEPPW